MFLRPLVGALGGSTETTVSLVSHLSGLLIRTTQLLFPGSDVIKWDSGKHENWAKVCAATFFWSATL